MSLHPLALSVLAADLTSLGLLAVGAAWALRVLLSWDPSSAAPPQLRLERQAEAVGLLLRWCAAAFALATLLWVLGVALALPAVVPGAMCGSGVMQAMRGQGERALLARALAAGALWSWLAVHAVGRRHPRHLTAETEARLLLVAAPLAVLSAWLGAAALLSLNSHDAVDCCAATYAGRLASSGAAASRWGQALGWWLFALSSLALPAAALRVAAGPNRVRAWAFAIAAALWVPSAALTLTHHLSAYVFQVPAHRCPWCLFLPQHHMVGAALFGALAVVALEAVAALAAQAVAAGELAPFAGRRLRVAAQRALVAWALFMLLSLAPALAWRWRYGTWL